MISWFKETLTAHGFRCFLILGLWILLPFQLFANVDSDPLDHQNEEKTKTQILKSDSMERFSILGQRQSLPTQPGSAHIVTLQELEKFEFTDINQVLRGVPGVNLQEEDGFGLRPNIGLRGAHPHRSRKVTLLEHGLLIAPAAYSAPAAYYFPLLGQISGVEVFKGPSASMYGPNSVGGAVNLITRRNDPGIQFKGRYGLFNTQFYQASLGLDFLGQWSLDIIRNTSDGFKTLKNGGETGFEKHSAFLRWDFSSEKWNQQWMAKLQWSKERSNETYLGVTSSDFAARPYERYAASQRDQVNWQHWQGTVQYSLEPLDDLLLNFAMYRHGMDRSWNKYDGFFDQNLNTRSILFRSDEVQFRPFYETLVGLRDSQFTDRSDLLRITDNRRKYKTQGLQWDGQLGVTGDRLFQNFRWGYRFHQDSIIREHESQLMRMENGSLASSSLANEILKNNEHKANAHTAYIKDEFSWTGLELSAGIRAEFVNYNLKEYETLFNSEDSGASSELLWAGGLNGFVPMNKGGLLLGINRGGTLVGPGQEPNVDQEIAINYELGYRHTGQFSLEAVGFFSDYQNILGTCTLSSGCAATDLDQRFNSGKAHVYGVEFLAAKDFKWSQWRFPIKLNFTWTEASFQSDFVSTLSDWGLGSVKKGDPVPYVPRWQGRLELGVKKGAWAWYTQVQFVSSVVDQAVQSPSDLIGVERFLIPYFLVTHTSLNYQILETLKVHLRVENFLNSQYAVSARPFGFRPGRPLMAFLGVEYGF